MIPAKYETVTTLPAITKNTKLFTHFLYSIFYFIYVHMSRNISFHVFSYYLLQVVNNMLSSVNRDVLS